MSKQDKDREQKPPSENGEPPDRGVVIPKTVEAASGLLGSVGTFRRKEWRSDFCVIFD